jgi:hypothetical protein
MYLFKQYYIVRLDFFFERTAQDSACFIDIEEKYKTTTLGSHSQATKKKGKKTTHPVGLGHQHGYHSNGRSDWDLDTTTLRRTTIHHRYREEDATAARAHQHTPKDIEPIT